MTNITKKILLPTLVLLTLLNHCQLIRPIEISNIDEINVASVSLKSAEVNFVLNIVNPNPVSVKLVSADLTLLLNEKETVTVQQTFDEKLPANSEIALPLKTTLQYSDLFGGSIALLMGVINNTGEAHLTGVIRIKVLGITQEIPISIRREVN